MQAIQRLVVVVLLTYLSVLAEEESILNSAAVGDYDIDFKYRWNEIALIDGNFKSLIISGWRDINGDGTKELKIILPKEQRIIAVYISN